ncbi:MAG: response regulator [Natronospirillum sp.]|uniref:response regulator n=1 Tax=Natronospirillum sp. TaxID=2812955 RepID=UPI0025CF6AF0|nr:response regulator [Natronospirillum sp.]MCH8550382.1 response regulator [Natronospirillum sp.]
MTSQNTQNDAGLQAFLAQLTVLYVEDNSDIREQLTLFLRRRFKTVLVAADGAEGLKTFRQAEKAPDLVITDIRMPVMDGLNMIGYIREHDDNVPVIVTTAHEENDFLLKTIDVGVDAFVVKPIDTQQLVRALLKIGGRLRSEQALAEARQSLHDNEARYRAIFWTAMDAFCVFDWTSLNVLEINRRFQALYGYGLDDMTGRNLDMLFDSTHGTALRALIEETEQLREPMVVRHLHRDGTMFPVEMTIGQFRSGEVGYGLMAIRDARERIDSMDEQDAVVDALEITIDALEGMLDR